MCGEVMKRINFNGSKTPTHARLARLGAIVIMKSTADKKMRSQLLKIVTEIVYTVSKPHYLAAWHLPLAVIVSTKLCATEYV